MNKEEVIKSLKEYSKLCWLKGDYATILNRAIELLQEPTGMKERILEKINQVVLTHSSPVMNGHIVTRLINGDGIDRLIDFIQSLPDTQPEPKQCAKNAPMEYPGHPYQKLFDYLHNELNTTALQGQMDDIIQIVREMDKEPTRLPFQFPIPSGFEVVTRDGRKVEQLTEFKGIRQPLIGVLEGNQNTVQAWGLDGKYDDDANQFDLFLLPIERKVWVVEWEGDVYAFLDKSDAESMRLGITDATIYEATLKQLK